MGIFSDKCPECGERVSKRARFCGKCGKGAPKGWWKCPECGKWVGNESEYCWNCRVALQPDTRDMIAGGVWQKPGKAFAQRFEVGNLGRLVKKGLHVQAGTSAILMDGGKIRDVLEPGRHNVDSLGRRINNWGSPPPRSAVLVDSGDVALPLEITNLRSHEELPLTFYGEVVLRFNPKKKAVENFVANLLKESQSLGYDDISQKLINEIRQAVENECNRSTIEDLVKDPTRRLRLEDELQQVLATGLDRFGLLLVRVSSAQFDSEEYEELREQAGELEKKARSFEFDQRMRDLLKSDKMDEFKSEQELEEYVAQLAHERDISEAQRDQELDLLRQVYRQEIETKEADDRMAGEMKEAAHDIGIKEKYDDYERQKAKTEALTEDEIERIKAERDHDEAEWALDLRKKKEQIQREDEEERRRVEREDEARRVEGFEGKSMQAMVAAIQDPGRQKALLELNRQLQQEGMSVEEILAANADGRDAAQALVEMARTKADEQQQSTREQERILNESAERMERILKEALKTTSEAARNRGGETHIVK